jgi:predicted ATPase/class 3 adenylate cyclase
LMFTDIEGSTNLWENHPDLMSTSLERHDVLMREAIESSNGYVFKTVGDAFCAAFPTASDAVAAAIAAQQALTAEPWTDPVTIRVRIALHSGVCHERDGDYFGRPVNRTARLEATAHGGQTVLSTDTAELVAESMPAGASLRDMGQHRLKDLSQPERVFQLDIEGLVNDFAPLRSLDNPELENNLPTQMSSFIGREKELGEIKELVKESRLVTLTAFGGSGKTRLSLQVAAEMLDGTGGGVWFVDLAPITEPGLVAAAVAQAIGVREESGRPVSETLLEAIGDRFLLIVLDNCEQVIDACAKLADAILRSCPKTHILATSREPLQIGGERIYRVPTLSLPNEDDSQAADSEAVRLFLERATDARPDFVMDERNTQSIVSICRQIDGMPLAIELAAARVGSMDVADIEARLNKRFALLKSTSRSVLPRQQTLRALVDWSYDLLVEHERDVLCRLSVFAGGWDLRAAESLCLAEDMEVFELADTLRSLVDKSLVQTDDSLVGLRYNLLETIRQFAGEKLTERGEIDTAVRCAHADYFLDLAERASPELRGPDQAQWLDKLEADLDNLRVATDRFLADPEAGNKMLRITVGLARFFQARHMREGVEVLTAALAHPSAQAEDSVRAAGLGILGDLMEGRDRRQYIEAGLEIARTLDDDFLTATLLTWLSWCAYQEGDLQKCSELSEEAVELARRTGDPGLLGRALVRRAIAVGHADPSKAGPATDEALSSLRQAGDRRWEATALCNLASFEVIAENLDAADVHYSQALVIVEELHDKSGVTVILAGMGEVAMLRGDTASAKELYSRALRGAYRDRERRGAVYLLLNLAQCYAQMDDELERAAMLYGASDAQNEQLGLPWELGIAKEREEGLAFLTARIDESAYKIAYSTGRGLTLDAAVSLALEENSALLGAVA